MSLSRNKLDKVNGTGRFHLMKNRYGLDGLTFSIKADASIGEFKILKEYFEDDEESTMVPQTQSNSFDTVDKYDKKALRNKFFELQP